MAGRENGIDIPFKVGVKKKTQQSRSWDKEIVAPIGADCVRLQVY
jgi:hypothetical protein